MKRASAVVAGVVVLLAAGCSRGEPSGPALVHDAPLLPPDETPSSSAPDEEDHACHDLAGAFAAARPADPSDLLFYVNRAAGIPAAYPFSANHIWTPCSWDAAPGGRPHDFLCIPGPYVFRTREALRRVAFESDAPADVPTTFDGLAVGREGKIGFKPLLDAAREAGHVLYVRSGFRSYMTQRATFAMWIEQAVATGHTREWATRNVTMASAHAGHSEHQLGTTVDLVFRHPDGSLYEGWDPAVFEASPAMAWVKANAHRFGVVLTYPEHKVDVTQYKWEPWHWRFVGVAAAGWAKRCDLSTEELLEARYGLPAPPPLPPGLRTARR